MRLAVFLWACMTLTGCTTTKQAAEVLHSSWEGQPVDAFFVKYGPPVSQYTMADGGKIFTWIGGRADVSLPGSASTTTNFVGNTAVSTTTYDDPADIHLGCKVQIVTAKDGSITSISPVGDSIGMWQTSRCAEIFGVSSR